MKSNIKTITGLSKRYLHSKNNRCKSADQQKQACQQQNQYQQQNINQKINNKLKNKQKPSTHVLRTKQCEKRSTSTTALSRREDPTWTEKQLKDTGKLLAYCESSMPAQVKKLLKTPQTNLINYHLLGLTA